MKKVLILPDIHGRSFWKESINRFLAEYPLDKIENKDNKIIFLGDYVDPYTWIDNISNEDAFNNFLELLNRVVDLNNKQPGLVVMLLGNHDLHYIYDTGEDCRLDYNRFDQYSKIFLTLIDTKKIQIACSLKMSPDSDVNWLFSHSGVQLDWFVHTMNAHQVEVGDVSASTVASLLNTHIQDIYKQLGEVSYFRGGYDKYGSCLWADLNEMKGNNVLSLESKRLNNGTINQVFAHTYLSEPYIDKRIGIYMLDTGFSSYLLDENDNIEVYLKGDRFSYR